MKLSRSLIAVGAIAALSVGALAGCSSSGSNADDDSGATGAALTIAKPDGAITTESHNPYLGDSSASKYGYAKVIFEPLALVNPTGDLGTTPWLAESVEWNDDYTAVTVVPRSGVRWSDGTDFTGDDIVFTFDQYLSGKLADSSGLKYEGATVDGDAITLTFADSKFTAQSRVLHTPIVPKHIWENIEDPNTDPLTGEGLAVGTGPYVLDSWTTESVTLSANEGYWGGDLAVPELHYVSYGDNAALTTALASGEADWAQAFIPQIQASYLDADPDNQFLVSPTAGAGTLFFNLQTKPFNDPALREALAWTIDRDAYVDIAREGASEAVWNVTGLGTLLEDEIAPEYKDENYSVDVDKAKDILTDAGYTWESDKLIDPDGEAVSFSISVPAGWSDWNTEQALIAEELDEALGIEVKVDQPDWGGWDAARQEGTFQAIIHWLEDTGNVYGLYTSTMDPKWIVDDKAQYNFGRFDDPAVTEALNTYANASSDEDRAAASAVMQKAFAENVPAIPLGAHPLLGEFNTRNYVGWPSEDDQYASGDPTQPGIVQVLTNLEAK
ncbi:ABC transporter substrate-binding protein [Microbacterium aerolatum]|uniref:Peptide ABC transporter substrate-binding protein n=2 Tax=Microbacterium aerolatum TaxID=153731 RepID=A0A511AI12_9MICO|nr:ABC transporter substrate-binding protein [Microbacterium aerolatum]GEK87824.1 peptide ABC transporter substrate-binding protein [Microbacterium aerolatum]GGB32727.1 peptide ABC transporter substrate-binding protein [Microbacterium aerolatum]